MELYVYSQQMEMKGIVERITSLIWTRRYWSAGEFKLLVPFTESHVGTLVKNNIIMKRGDTEAAEILYVNIKKNKQGREEIEVQGRFLTNWIGKRIIEKQIIATDNSQNIIKRIVTENVTNPQSEGRRIQAVELTEDEDIGRGNIEYKNEPYINALLAVEEAAKASKLGFKMVTDVRAKTHYFSIYDGRNLTADQTDNQPCIFSQEFDNIVEQEYTNSVENLKTTAYVGGEEVPDTARTVVEVGGQKEGLERQEIFINATDITRKYQEGETEITIPEDQYIALLNQRGAKELEQYAETLNFNSNINVFGNLQYKKDYDVGDRVTCINKKWRIKINVRITEVAEIYEREENSIAITFGESLPALIDKIRQIAK